MNNMENLIVFIALMTALNFIATAVQGWILYRVTKDKEQNDKN